MTAFKVNSVVHRELATGSFWPVGSGRLAINLLISNGCFQDFAYFHTQLLEKVTFA
jgi:hypothetical protein